MKDRLPLLFIALLFVRSAEADDPKQRARDWLPTEGTLVLPVQESSSPDGRFAIGWGYEKGPVDWAKLAFEEPAGGDWGAVTFSTKLAEGELSPDLENDANFLLDLETGKTLCRLGIDYPGERPRFNHDGLVVHWSPSSSRAIVIVTQKWFTEYAHLVRIREGAAEGSHDILAPLTSVGMAALLKSDHPAAARLRTEADFVYTVDEVVLRDDDTFTACVSGVVPKLDQPAGYFEVKVSGRFGDVGKDGAILLESVEAEVVPVE